MQHFKTLEDRLLDAGPSRFSPRRARIRAWQKLTEKGFPYSRTLSAHTACVNALAFSPDSKWLASAGDDPYVYLWDFHQEQIQVPSKRYIGPRANVFALAFSASSQYLYSGDTNDIIHQYDVSRLPSPTTSPSTSSIPTSSPNATFALHTDSIRAISCHPQQEHTFLSASEDGFILFHDTRVPRIHPPIPARIHGDLRRPAQGAIAGDAEMTGVQWHPTMAHIFVGSDSQGRVRLWDSRAAFGGEGRGGGRQRGRMREDGVVMRYVTTLARKGVNHLSNPEASSVVFDPSGDKLAVTLFHYLPTIYALNVPYPIATCSGRVTPTNEKLGLSGGGGYSNSCTIKHGSFGSTAHDDQDGTIYAAGSDDFRAYVWRIPRIEELKVERSVVKAEDMEEGCIGFSEGVLEPRSIPVELSTPHSCLTGHKSIINTALFHPHSPRILTAGIERDIVLHSAVKEEAMEETPTEVRRLPERSGGGAEEEQLRRRLLGVEMDEEMEDDNEGDETTIALFDEILRQEAEGDVFMLRRWPSGHDEEMWSDEAEEDRQMNMIFEETLGQLSRNTVSTHGRNT